VALLDPDHRSEILRTLEIPANAVLNTAEFGNGPTWQFFELKSVADVLAADSSKVSSVDSKGRMVTI
jgi:hypothetical protein